MPGSHQPSIATPPVQRQLATSGTLVFHKDVDVTVAILLSETSRTHQNGLSKLSPDQGIRITHNELTEACAGSVHFLEWI